MLLFKRVLALPLSFILILVYLVHLMMLAQARIRDLSEQEEDLKDSINLALESIVVLEQFQNLKYILAALRNIDDERYRKSVRGGDKEFKEPTTLSTKQAYVKSLLPSIVFNPKITTWSPQFSYALVYQALGNRQEVPVRSYIQALLTVNRV